MKKLILILVAMMLTTLSADERDSSALDRRHCELMRQQSGLPFGSDQEWEQVRDSICRQRNGIEYEFYIGLKPKMAAVVDAQSAGEAMDALTELDDYIRKTPCGKCATDYMIRRSAPGRRRMVGNAMLDHLLFNCGKVEAKRIVEGWLAVPGWNVLAALDRTVLECGFTPGARVTGGLQDKFDEIAKNGRLCDDNGNPVFRWKDNPYLFRCAVWRYRWEKTEKLFVCLDNISCEVSQIADIFGRMGKSEANRKKYSMKAKSTLKSALAKIDRETKMYSSLQSDKFSRWLDLEEYEKWDLRLEALAAHCRLLERIGEMVSMDDACKKMVDDRLAALKRHVSSVEEKRAQIVREPNGFKSRPCK